MITGAILEVLILLQKYNNEQKAELRSYIDQKLWEKSEWDGAANGLGNHSTNEELAKVSMNLSEWMF